ncbi:acyl-CoA Delta(11) desaturase-like [Trichoplusia ni]|uniref:Acyl-CoA Delta(11) desaturase-like n=1 Tax=Trichoplusia ni TaxID=7111 RepID=A0A7E5WQC1_TRINI|nr:acyl-CoA Delta(11) desaturase-like [Trichoplusia ni]XP_026742946.1 acyl-CoA Delta(11) desaturase-like [Trichoplusia ni]
MPPNGTIPEKLFEDVCEEPETQDINNNILSKLDPPTIAAPRKYEVVYKNFLTIGYMHAAALYGLYLCFTQAKWATVIYAYLSYVAATIGVTAGAHRLWSHKAFKATFPLQVILMLFLSIANQRATHWVRDHRTHHKYSDTDADPHNASRGFFYSHIGWLFVKKHPEVKKRGKLMDLSDIYSNPVLMFQHRHAKYFLPTMCFVIPTLIPMIFWGETFNNAWNITLTRYIFNAHVFFLVNSAAHIFGNKPYDKDILSGESNIVSLATFGEGFHNYHHVFPWDYRNAELGGTVLNYTKVFIDLAAAIGWAYDLKTVPKELVYKRALRSGDGSHQCAKVERPE